MNRQLLAAIALACTPSCLSMFGGKVGTGIARLTVRNIGAMVGVTSADASCGFASQAVKDAATVEGAIGEIGSITWRVESCTINLPDWTTYGSDCHGNQKQAI